MSTPTSLFDAVKNNDLFTVNSLIQNGTCDVNVQDDTDDTPLHVAVWESNIEIVRCILDKNTCDVNIQDRDGYTPLHIAVFARKIEFVKCLTEHTTCDVNIRNLNGDTPLHLSVFGEGIDKSGSDVNIQCFFDTVSYYTTVNNCRNEFVRWLLDQTTCDINLQDNAGNTPLHGAVVNIYTDSVRCLLDHTDCDANVRNSDGNTPLHLAVRNNTRDNVCSLLDRTDCDVNVQNSDGNTPLHLAVDTKNEYIANILQERGNCDSNIHNNRGETPLHRAVRFMGYNMLGCLLEKGNCDVNIQDCNRRTPLHLAVEKCNICVTYIIKQSNCNVNIKNLAGLSPFCTTKGEQFICSLARCRDVELANDLIKHNTDVLTNHVNNRLQIVKSILSENDFQSLWFLIQNGLYINSLTSSGENIVHLLAQFYINYLYIDFCFLFDYGLDFNLINNNGYSPLMVASLLNNLPFIQFLAALPCDVNRQNHQGHTALHLCITGFTLIKEKLNTMKVNSVVKNVCSFEYYPRYLACIDVLLNLDADVNIQDYGGKTVLMLACMKNDRKLLETLLIGGADMNIVDRHGRSALQYIDLTNNVYDLTCFNLLLSHGCRQSFNQSCLNGNTIIQNVLLFTPLWQIDDIVNFIKFLVFKNVNLQHLTSDDGEISYGQLSLEEFPSESRHELRQLLYLSGGSFAQITQIIHFEAEEYYEASLPKSLRENPREKCFLVVNNLSLKDTCRRVIRQHTGLAIHGRISELFDSSTLNNFLMFKDIDSKRFSLPTQLEYSIDDEYDDDYNSYDLNIEKDDYVHNYEYLNEVSAGLKYRKFSFKSLRSHSAYRHSRLLGCQ